MIFYRSIPPAVYSDYRLYRPLLRHDFQFRCAYCLRHEYFLGGEAGCAIDHHQPMSGDYARPELIAEYTNLYWCCRECNENKGSSWPTPDEHALGYRFLDPCQPNDDHDRHLDVQPDGTLKVLTNAGQYTSDTLRLWRAQLTHYRAEMLRCQIEIQEIRTRLADKNLPLARREGLDALLVQLSKWLEPPVFDRPRHDSNTI